MGISARKVNNYDLYSGHAWYVPGIKGMFGFIGWLPEVLLSSPE